NDWQDLAAKYGPGLIRAMDAVVKDIDKNMPTWENWLAKLIDVSNQLIAIPGLNLAAQDSGAAGASAPLGSPHRADQLDLGRAVPGGKYSEAVRWDTWQQRYVMDTNNYTGPALPAD